MKIVIDILDDEYKKLVNPYQYNEALCDELKMIVRNGIPLPKGHGDLIDRSNLITITDIRTDVSEITYVLYSDIANAPTIIEADISGKEIER